MYRIDSLQHNSSREFHPQTRNPSVWDLAAGRQVELDPFDSDPSLSGS